MMHKHSEFVMHEVIVYYAKAKKGEKTQIGTTKTQEPSNFHFLVETLLTHV